MKKILTLTMALLFASAVFAQESNRDVNGNFQYGPYETNTFASNWFVDAGAGFNLPIDNIADIKYDFGGLATNVNVGKWIDPCYGFRVGWQGLTTGNLDNRISFPESFDGNHYFNYLHGDVLLNLSNLAAGYKETRTVNVVPYFTTGFAFSNWNTNRSFAMGGGVQVPVRINDRISVVPEAQIIAMNSRVYGGNSVTANTSVDICLRINLGKSNWTRKASTANYYNGIIDEYESKLAAAQLDIDTLTAQNKALPKVDTITIYVHDTTSLINGFIVYFEIGKSTLSVKEKEHLLSLMNNYKDSNAKFVAIGVTDTSTGSAKRNAKLRKERAEYVADLLHETYNITVEANPQGLQDINIPELSRAVVLTW